MRTQAIYVVMFTAAAIALWHPLARRERRLPRWFGLLFRSGHAFLPVGLLLGLFVSSAPGAHERLLSDMWPVVAFVAGWVGYSVGIRLDWHHLKALVRDPAPTLRPRSRADSGVGPHSERKSALVQGLSGARGLLRAMMPSAIAGAVAIGAGMAALRALGVEPAEAIPLALVLGAAGACSGAPLLARLAKREHEGSPDRARFVHLVTAARADDIVVCGLALAAFASIPALPGAPSAPLALLLPLVGGAGLGAVAWLLLGGTAMPDERLLLGLAVLGIGAGLGAWIEVSPAVVCAVLAATLATLPGGRARALREPVEKLGRPAIVILMLAAGLAVAPHLSWVMLAGGGALVVLRAAAFAVAGWLDRENLGADARLLSAPGRLGLVVAFTFYHLVGGVQAAEVLGAVALAAFVDQFVVSRQVALRVHAAVEAPCEEV